MAGGGRQDPNRKQERERVPGAFTGDMQPVYRNTGRTLQRTATGGFTADMKPMYRWSPVETNEQQSEAEVGELERQRRRRGEGMGAFLRRDSGGLLRSYLGV